MAPGRASGGAPAPARRVAHEVLRRIDPAGRRRPGTAHRPDTLLEALDPDGSGDPVRAGRDRALARRLVFGVLRHLRLLDFVLDRFSRRPVRRLDPSTRVALRIGLYQLRWLDRVPASAAVHDSVALAAGRRPGADRLVNAVLRAYLRDGFAWPTPPDDAEPGDDGDAWLRIGLSHPDWLVDRYLARLGREGARARAEANSRNPGGFVRVRPDLDPEQTATRLRDEGIEAEPFPLVPGCLRIVRGNVHASALLAEGALYVQDAGSQLIGWLVPLDGSVSRVLDACAAPGGKTGVLAGRLKAGTLIAADVRTARTALLRTTLRRTGADRVLALSADAGGPPFPDRSFDRILLDVPCSGLGTLARNPDIKWTMTPTRLARRAEEAGRLFCRAARLLTDGGILVYSTCSNEPEETTGVVNRFLERSPGFARFPLAGLAPEAARRFFAADGSLRLAPESAGTDGYFAAGILRGPREGEPGPARRNGGEGGGRRT